MCLEPSIKLGSLSGIRSSLLLSIACCILDHVGNCLSTLVSQSVVQLVADSLLLIIAALFISDLPFNIE